MSTLREKMDEVKALALRRAQTIDPKEALIALVECGEWADHRNGTKYSIAELVATGYYRADIQGQDAGYCSHTSRGLLNAMKWLARHIEPCMIVDNDPVLFRGTDTVFTCPFGCGDGHKGPRSVISPDPRKIVEKQDQLVKCDHFLGLASSEGRTHAFFATDEPMHHCDKCERWTGEADECERCGEYSFDQNDDSDRRED